MLKSPTLAQLSFRIIQRKSHLKWTHHGQMMRKTINLPGHHCCRKASYKQSVNFVRSPFDFT